MGIPTQETRLCDASLHGKPIVLMLDNLTPMQDLGLQPLDICIYSMGLYITFAL